MIEVPFHKLVVAVWNNKAGACVCAFIHMGVIENIAFITPPPVKQYILYCLYVKMNIYI